MNQEYMKEKPVLPLNPLHVNTDDAVHARAVTLQYH